jgi:hypothetical protein
MKNYDKSALDIAPAKDNVVSCWIGKTLQINGAIRASALQNLTSGELPCRRVGTS